MNKLRHTASIRRELDCSFLSSKMHVYKERDSVLHLLSTDFDCYTCSIPIRFGIVMF